MNDDVARVLFAWLGDETNPMPGTCYTDWGATYHFEALQIKHTNAGNFFFSCPPPHFEHGKIETAAHMAQLLDLVKGE